jgi:hypothetical protein
MGRIYSMVGEMRNMYTAFSQNYRREKVILRPGNEWDGNSEIDLKEVEYESLDSPGSG